MKQAIVHWYRFCKLCGNNMHRWEDQFPVWPGWVFSTDESLIKTIIYGRELWHSRNASEEGRNLTQRLRFYQRWLDPMILPVVRQLLRLLNCLDKHQSNDNLMCSDHPGDYRLPGDAFGLCSLPDTMPISCREASLSESSDALCNVSSSLGVILTPNEQS